MAVLMSSKAQSDNSQRPSVSSNTNKPAKFGGAFKKVGQYFREQAQQQSHSALYLSPRDPYVQKHMNSITEQELIQHFTATNLNDLPYGVVPPLSSNDNTPRSSSMTTESTTADTSIFASMTRHQYASDNILQSYDVLIPDRQLQDTKPEDGYFLIFIHGGYFRDPKQTSKSFNATISLLEESESNNTVRKQITGYASLNYRLAPHPGHPQDPRSTPPYTLNNTLWPDQPNDILAALRHIQSHYPQSHRYILAGHSVGATLSLVAALRASEANIIPPAHVIGICGIYDFPLIHKTNPGYVDMTRNAIEPSKFKEASPALYDEATYSRKWTSDQRQNKGEKRRILLAHSRKDELVNWEQVESMYKVFGGETQTQTKTETQSEFQTEILEIEGSHYSVLENGEVARCFREVLGVVS